MTSSLKNRSSTAAGSDHQIEPYDYRGKTHFPPAVIESINEMHEAFARDLARRLQLLLQVPAAVVPRPVDEARYNSYVQSLPSPAILGVIGLNPTDGRAIVDIANHLGFAMLDTLLGGTGQPTEFRSFTDLEGALLLDVMDHVTGAMSAAFAGVAQLAPEILGLQAHPSIGAVIDPAESVLVMSFDVTVSGLSSTTGIVSICYPAGALGPLMGVATEVEPAQPLEIPDTSIFEEPLSRTSVQIRARLTASPISLAELAALQPGDVVVLSHRANQPVIVSAGGRDLLQAHVGQTNKKMALSITEWTV